MKDNGRKGVEGNLTDIEKDLGRLSPVAAPAGLRDRVMDRATGVQKSAALSPRMRILAAACSVMILAVLILDPLIGKHETAQLAAILDGRPSVRQDAKGIAAPELAEILDGQGNEADRITRFQSLAASTVREGTERDFFEARKRLKGWLNNETSENLN